MEKQVILAIAIAIMFFAVYFAWDYFRKQWRLKQMRDAAARLGYEFQEEELNPLNALGEFALFHRGKLGRTTHLLRASVNGTAVTIFDHRYITGHGRRQCTYSQSVLLLESDQLELPVFALRPEGLGAKLKGLRGQQDIDIEEQPGFSAAYVLQGPAEAQIRALFSGVQLAFFAQRPGLCVEGNGQRLLYYRARKRVSPKAIPSFVEEGLLLLHTLVGK